MKNRHYERLWRQQREYHRRHPWGLSEGGLYIPHSYADKPDSLSWCDDVGFILNGRRVIVAWQHPRQCYADALDDQARQRTGVPPGQPAITAACTKNYRRVGKARKRIVSYTCPPVTVEQRHHHERHQENYACLSQAGIDFVVTPTWRSFRTPRATVIDLIAPLEVCNPTELAEVARLARRLLRGDTTLEAEYPAYRYGRADWLGERVVRDANSSPSSAQ